MSDGTLKRALGPVSLWGLGVGYVISGEYFGWNLGLPVGGTYGMLAATLFVTLLYATFVPCYAELACAMPDAGGAFTYVRRAFGPRFGAFAGFAQAVEFTFAPPAIAMAIGSYVAQQAPWTDPRVVALIAYVLFTALNAWGVRIAARFELVVTILAVGELLLFAALTLPHFDAAAFAREPLPNGVRGAFDALPFALWFYLAIEGLANAGEEAEDPSRDLSRGFLSALVTLLVLALLVFVAAVGVSGWRAIVYPNASGETSDAPLPLALGFALGRDSPFYGLLVGIGLLGLVASFHGILLAAARSNLALARAGLLPRVLAHVHEGSGTPRRMLGFDLVLGLVAIATGKTAEIITLSCFGAVTLYVTATLAYFRLRRREPELPRPYRAYLHPVGPSLALATSSVAAAALAVGNPRIALVFVAMLAPALLAKGANDMPPSDRLSA